MTQTWAWKDGQFVGAGGKCMAMGGLKDGDPIILSGCGEQSKWRRTSSPQEPGVAIVNGKTGQCMNVPAAKFDPGTQLIVWTCMTSYPNELFQLSESGQITTHRLCLDAYPGSLESPVVLRKCEPGSKTQSFSWQYGQLRGAFGTCLDKVGPYNDNGAKLVMADCANASSWRTADAVAVNLPVVKAAPALAPTPPENPTLKAAQLGDARAMWSMSVRYAQGDGVPRDERKSAEWLIKAADGGVEGAIYDLADAHEQGYGGVIPKDPAKMIHLWELLALRHYADAEHALALSYIRGEYVIKNEVTGLSYMRDAARDGSDLARDYLRQIGQPYGVADPGAGYKGAGARTDSIQNTIDLVKSQRRENCQAAAKGADRYCRIE